MGILKILTAGLLFIYGFSSPSSGQENASKGFGLALKASTNGLGADAVVDFHRGMTLRLGYETLAINRDVNFTESEVDYSANMDLTTGSASVLVDFYLIKHLFITAGIGWNLFHAEIDGHATSPMPFGDINIPADKIGVFNFQVDPSLHISPYAGIGLGRTLALDKRLGFAFELGGFYQGAPDITIASTGMLSPTSNPEHGQESRLEKQINQYTVYPVIKLSLSYKLVRF